MKQLFVSKDDVLSEQQEWNPNLNQMVSEPPNVKEEQEELWSEEEEKPQSSQVHQSQRDESTEVAHLASSSSEHRTLKIEAEGDDCGGSQPASDSSPCSHLQPDTDDMQQLLPIKEESLSERQEWNLIVDQVDIKEEQEKLWVSQQGQQLEEADVTKFSFTAVPVKTENDDKKPESSQVHQSQSDESTEAEPVASSSNIHRTLTAQTDREDDGGPKPASNSGPYSRSVPGTNGKSSNTCDWKPASDLVYVCPSSCNIAKKQLNCSEPGKVRGLMKYSKKHKRREASEKLFCCPIRGKMWKQKTAMNRQMRNHPVEKLFDCLECGKRFRQKGSLTKHMRIHAGEKPFGCPECGKRFIRKGSLDMHMRVHTGQKPFVCIECGKRFSQSCSLTRHTKIHTGEKPYGCPECDKRFGQKGNLDIHMRIHTGQKPFACSDCEKRFGQKGNLIRHMRIHAGHETFGLKAGKWTKK